MVLSFRFNQFAYPSRNPRIFPVHRDIMDIGPPSQSSICNASNIVTRTRTVREYEQTINELKKENFDLKLRVFWFEEKERKISSSKENSSPENDNVVRIMVKLNLETESLKNQLNEKEKLLQDTIEQAEKFASENEELNKKLTELQSELASLAEHPSREDYDLLQKQNEDLAKLNKSLTERLSEKEDELRMSEEKIEMLGQYESSLVEKKEKAYVLITGMMNKDYEKKLLLPDPVLAIVESAVKAAKNQNKDDLKMALRSFNIALNRIMLSSNRLTPIKELNDKESTCSVSQCKRLTSCADKKDKTYPPPTKNSRQSEYSKETRKPLQPEDQNLQSITPLGEKFSQKDILDFSNTSEETESYSLPNLSNRSQQILLDASPSTFQYAESVNHTENKQALLDALEENKQLKQELEEKLVLVNDLKNLCQNLKSKLLERKKDDDAEASRAVNNESSSSLLQLKDNIQLPNDDIIQLREDNLLMSLTLEEKEKELEDLKQTLSCVQAKLDKALDNQHPLSEEAMNEKNELLERLASSSQVNEDLMRHLQNLETFMESLLQHIMNNSNLDSSEQSSFLSQVSMCFNQSRKLTSVLSDHLSICEGSKFFDECSRISLRNHSEDRSFPNLDVSESSFADYHAAMQQQKGMPSFGGENIIKCIPSSDSDIWSEPDRDVSLQRIGIDVQFSPHSFKSPRKSRTRRRYNKDHNNSSTTTDLQPQHTFRISRRHGIEKGSAEQSNQRHSKSLLVTSSSELEKCKEEIKNLKEEKNTNNIKLKNADQKISEMQEALDAKQKEQKSLSLRIERLQSEKESLSSKCKELQSDLNNTSKQLSDCQKECDAYKDDSMKKTEILNANKREIEILKQTIERLQFSEKSLQSKCRELQSAIENVKNKQSDIQNQCDIYKEILQNKKETIDADKKELELLNRRIKLLQTERDSLSVKCDKLQSALENSKSESPDTQIHDKDSESKRNSSNVHKDELDSLRKEIEKLHSEKEAISAKYAELESKTKSDQNQSIHNTEAANGKELESLHKNIEKLNNDNSLLSERIISLESALEKVEKQCQIYKEDALDKEESLETYKKELNSLSENIKMLQDEKNTLSVKYNELLSALENQRHEFSNVQDETDNNVDVMLDANEKEAESLKEKIEILENEKESLSKEYKELKLKLAASENKNSNLQTQCDDYKEEIRQKNNSLDENKKEQEILSSKCKEMQAKLENIENKLCDLKNQNDIYKAEAKEKSDALNACKEELKSLKQTIKESKSAEDSLCEKCNKVEAELENVQRQYCELKNQCEVYREQVVNKTRTLVEKEKEMECLSQTVEKLQLSEKSLSDKCKESEIDLQNASCEHSNLLKDCDIYKKKIADKTDCLIANEKELESLKRKIEQLQSTEMSLYKELKETAEKFDNEKAELQTKCAKYKQEAESRREVLDAKEKESVSLHQKIEELLSFKDALATSCSKLQSELENYKKMHSELTKQCNVYKEESLKIKDKFHNDLKEVEQKFKDEKEELVTEINKLHSEKESIWEKLKFEKDKVKNLKEEKDKVNQQIALLRRKNNELEQNCKSISDEKDSIQSSLLHSESRCVVLQAELAESKTTLYNLQSKCDVHIKELQVLCRQKDIVKNNILSAKSKLSDLKENLKEICVSRNIELFVESDKVTSSFNQNDLEELSKAIKMDSKKLSEIINVVLKAFKDSEQKSHEVQLNYEKTIIKLESMKKQIDLLKNQVEHLHKQNDILKHAITDKQNTLSDHEKRSISYNSEIDILKEKLKNEIEDKTSLINAKDDEIISLQERLLNLQTEMNNTLTEKTEKASESLHRDLSGKCDNSTFSWNLLSSMTDSDEHNSDEPSISSRPQNSCCENYWKRYRSLRKKLVLLQNRIKILEEQKESLRKFQISNSRSEESQVVGDKILDLQSQLDEKKIFIKELREELLNAHNAVIDREREVNSLKSQLKEKVDWQHFLTDTNLEIKNMRNFKWTLIREIVDIQKDFYKKKGIHSDCFEKFEKHIGGQYTSFTEDTISKSESQSRSPMFDPIADENKCLLGLKMDIEFLENLKIFLMGLLVVSSSPANSIHDLEGSLSRGGNKKNLGISEVFSSRKMKIDVLQENFRIDNFVLNVSKHLDILEALFRLAEQTEELPNLSTSTDGSDVETLVVKIFGEVKSLKPRVDELLNLNSKLKNLDAFPNKTDTSDQESVMSEETLSISGCETPSIHEKSSFFKATPEHLQNPKSFTRIPYEVGSLCQKKVRGSWEFVNLRSQYSSPDLGIESDPNHEICCPPSQREGYQESNPEENIISLEHCITLDMEKDKTCKEKDIKIRIVMDIPEKLTDPTKAVSLHAICNLSHYELLKREVQESLVGIKSVLSRTGDGMHHIGKHTSPRKTLEYNTLRAIKDTCANIQVCLKEAYSMVGKFWVAHCPTEQEWNGLLQENLKLVKQLNQFKALSEAQEKEYKSTVEKLEHALLLKANMEKNISRKLVKTKKVIRQAELKLLENRCQNNVPPLPKFPSKHSQ